MASRNLGDCRTLSPEACGKAKELSQRILDKGLPSVEDMRGKLASCQDDSCRKGVWTEYRQASDATINSLKQMALNGELSREELAFINHELGKELAVSGYRANDKIGRSEQSSWLNGGSGPLFGFFNTELRQKELENAGLSKADAAQYVKEEQRNLMLLETATGIIGGAASNKIQAKPSSVSSTKGSTDNKPHDETQPVRALDVSSYKELKSRAKVGDGLEHDHIPSFAALKKAKENELGRPLTKDETKALYQNATAVEIPRDAHKASPTYGGKNTPAQVQKDAMDLCGAVCRDTDALRKNMIERGYDPKLVDDAVKKVIERNRQTGVMK
ncbi:hypothetical protein ACSLVK_07330 [Photorhabdus tasmaniensis]|uniref:hypothetical protein n=1 Tax=Photorhabdus tasmaniensis TaxID=1004159 RepID=UPI0040426D51